MLSSSMRQTASANGVKFPIKTADYADFADRFSKVSIPAMSTIGYG
jgi:hypothetical protein